VLFPLIRLAVIMDMLWNLRQPVYHSVNGSRHFCNNVDCYHSNHIFLFFAVFGMDGSWQRHYRLKWVHSSVFACFASSQSIKISLHLNCKLLSHYSLTGCTSWGKKWALKKRFCVSGRYCALHRGNILSSVKWIMDLLILSRSAGREPSLGEDLSTEAEK
jgi:hypothetical protein